MLTTRTKYGNRRVSEDGYTFDSIAELAEYRNLRLLELAGEISELEVHPRFELLPQYKDPTTGKRERAIYYEADFSFREPFSPGDRWSRTVVLDVKGFETATWRLKRRLFLNRYRFPTYELRVLK